MDGNSKPGNSDAHARRDHDGPRGSSESKMPPRHTLTTRPAPQGTPAMTTNRTPLFLGLTLALVLPLLGACHRDAPPAAGHGTPDATAARGAPQTVLGKSVDAALRKAREELETGDLDISDGPRIEIGDSSHRVRIHHRDDDAPKASITPQGELVVAGRKVATTREQRDMLLAYRKQVIGIAEAGMALGVQGADLAGKALGEAFTGLLHGDTDALDQRMEAEGKRLEAEARKLCGQLPPMLETQQRLAASLPEFKPYARLTREDIDDCMKGDGTTATDADRARLREDIREGIREGIRTAIRRDSDDAQASDAAREADSAATE